MVDRFRCAVQVEYCVKRRLQGAVMNELREYDCYLSFEVQIFNSGILNLIITRHVWRVFHSFVLESAYEVTGHSTVDHDVSATTLIMRQLDDTKQFDDSSNSSE